MPAEGLTLGAGELWFAPFKPGTKTPDGMFHLGNCPTFEMTTERQVLEHMDSRRGIRDVDEEITIRTTLNGSITCDNISKENLALYFGTSVTSATKTVTSGSSLSDNTLLAVRAGRTYQIGRTTANPSGVRAITSVVVTNDAGSPTTYVSGTDYTVDLDRGLITILASGTITTGTNLEITYNQTAHTRDHLVVGDQAVEGELHYLAYNEVGARRDAWIPWVKLKPNGAYNFITGEDWATLGLSVTGLKLNNSTALGYLDGQPVV